MTIPHLFFNKSDTWSKIRSSILRSSVIIRTVPDIS